MKRFKPKTQIKGRISQIESMGLVDGPGIRCVVFLQGCNLRCLYCHNPETWDKNRKCMLLSPQELIEKISRFKTYFGQDGGVTFSGGEPLLQPEFLLECLKLCKNEGIHTALDTAGVGNGDYDEILKLVDLVILDIKAVKEEEYKKITGHDRAEFDNFLATAIKLQKNFWIRQVIVPNINDDEAHALLLGNFVKKIPNVEKLELLPYKIIGVPKYKDLGIKYRLDGTPEMDEKKCKALEQIVQKTLKNA